MKLFRKKKDETPTESIEPSLGQHMSKRKVNIWLGIVLLLFAGLVLFAGIFFWYQKNTAALNPEGDTKFFTVEKGDSANAIADRLHEEGFIRSSLAFKIALRLSDKEANIKTGKYRISPAENVDQIIKKLETGVPDIAQLTIIPGETLKGIKKQLQDIGYSKQSVERALQKDYDHPLLTNKPADASLEGYIYPDTYEVDVDQAPSAVIERTFDHFYDQLQANNLTDAFKKPGLTFHQAVILASIVEKEVNTAKDRPIVAQVFLKRLDIDMKLGADATFVYAAKQMGVKPAVELDSPYNTRVYKGLPPGPIASFTIDALEAVANPADTDYLYFVTGDNNVTHYGRTEEEHNRNVEKYCGEKCKL